jgi:hypothetical protein
MIPLEARLPQDPRLRELVTRAQDELAIADPLGAALLRGETGRLPDGSPDALAHETERLRTLAAELEALDGLEGDDELDRSALAHSIRRVTLAPEPRPPAGALLLERHLLAALVGLALAPQPRAEELGDLVESGPEFLEASRVGCLGANEAAGQVALAAAKRLPRLLDLTAAAAKALPLPAQLRERIEAGLGELLTAAAEDGGWLLKEYVPAAGEGVARLIVEPSGLGMSIDQVETAAEAMLADQAGLSYEEISAFERNQDAGPPAFPGGTRPGEPAGLAVVADACRRVEAACDPWCPDMGGAEFAVEAQPAWLQPLLPPLALAPGGPLASEPLRLLVGDGCSALSLPELERELAVIHSAEYLPAAGARSRGRMARLLLPAPESAEGWRALALAGAPGVARRSRRELGWRAILALVAIAIGRGRLDVGEAAGLIAAEAGMDPETARSQAVHVAAQPAAALTFVAGALATGHAVNRIARDSGDQAARAAVLAAGPLPGFLIDRLGYTR